MATLILARTAAAADESESGQKRRFNISGNLWWHLVGDSAKRPSYQIFANYEYTMARKQMNRWIQSISAMILLALATVTTGPNVQGQKLSAKKKPSPQQEYAILLLDSAIDELRVIEDIEARTSLAESIVTLLAARRPSRCRQMLNALFDDALALKEKSSKDNDDTLPNRDAIVRRVIQSAARFDRKLAESYIERYTRQNDTDTGDLQKSSKLTRQTADVYMRIAVDLAEKDPALDISVAQRALSVSVPDETLTFLGKLRRKDINLANGFFLSALGSVKARGGKDINELLLLYSYTFSPLQVLRVVPQGLGLLSLASYREFAVNYPIDSELARSYLTIATQIVLNPARYEAENFGRLTEGPRGDLVFVNIIEPQVATYLPSLVNRLSEQRVLSASFLQPDQRQQTEASLDRWSKMHRDDSSSGSQPNTSEYYLRWAEQTPEPKRKNQLYYRAASAAVREKKYDLALAIVDKMSDEYRDQAKEFIKYHIALQAAREGQFDVAEQWARNDGDLARRAYLYTLIADFLFKAGEKNIGRAAEFLNEAEQIAGKLNQNQERAAVLIGAAGVASQFDPGRAFNLLQDGIKTANKVEDFTGSTWLARSLDIGGFYFDYSLYQNQFTLAETVQRLAHANFDETVTDVREVKSRLARLRAIVSLCSGALAGTQAG